MGEFLSLRTIADLRHASLIPPVFVLGGVTPGDGSGGAYLYIVTDTPPPDNGSSVIVPTNPREKGYWLLCSAAGGGGGGSSAVVKKAVDYQILKTDSLVLVDCSGGNVALTLPQASALGAGNSQAVTIRRIDTSINLATVAPYAGDTMEAAGQTIYAAEGWRMQSDSVTNWYVTAHYQP